MQIVVGDEHLALRRPLSSSHQSGRWSRPCVDQRSIRGLNAEVEPFEGAGAQKDHVVVLAEDDFVRGTFPGVQVVSSDQYAGPTRETAKRAAENLLNRYGSQLQGIFTPNESSTIGMLLALQDMGSAGKIKLVGFDASQILIDALRNGQLEGIVVQNPMRMGYLGVKTMVDHLRGKQVDPRIDTGVMVVTPANLDSPEAKELVNPPVARYLPGG